MLVEANWGNFRAKFDKKEQETFEWFCSILFYVEHGQPTGAFRYFNHAGIEADPITVDKEVIGFQAKFLETRIADHEAELIAAIDKAKERHPKLTRVFFYLNRDFPQGRTEGSNDPQYKTRIEDHAKSTGVTIIWKTAASFESPFVCQENADVAKHFFTLGEKSVIDLVNELRRHTESLLEPIQSQIVAVGKSIKIDRAAFIEQLHEARTRSQLVVISGEAGSGKTAVIKDFRESLSETTPLFLFKAIEFNVRNLNEVFRPYGDFTISDFLDAFEGDRQKYIVVDSAEKLSDIGQPEVFQEFLSSLIRRKWTIIFTTRSTYLDDLRNSFIQFYGVNFEHINVAILSDAELNTLATQHDFALPQHQRLRELIRNPFYLHEYLQNSPEGEASISYSDFKRVIWDKRISKTSYRKDNIHRKRESTFLQIAWQRATSGNFYVSINDADDNALSHLEQDEIIGYDESAGGYFVAHDIYEEWALDRRIDQAFQRRSDFQAFLYDIGSSLAVRRAFRIWLSDKLAGDDADAMSLIEGTVISDNIERHWKDEVLVAVMLSDSADKFIERFEAKLVEKPKKAVIEGESSLRHRSLTSSYDFDENLLYRMLFLLRIACKEPDQSLLQTLGLSMSADIVLATVFTKPKGQGWKSVIAFVHRHKEELGSIFMNFVLPVLDDWNRYHKEGETTKYAAQTALYYFNTFTQEEGFYWHSRDETKDVLIRTIFNGSAEIKSELGSIFNSLFDSNDTSHRNQYYVLAETALSSITDSAEIAKNLPEEVIRLARLYWRRDKGDFDEYSYGGLDIEQYFNLADERHQYYPSSAFQTPTFQLLQTAAFKTVDFILSLTDDAVEHFAKTEFARYEVDEIDVVVDASGATVKQYICHRLWNIYRGTQVAPAVLEATHMALEKWLLYVAKNFDAEIVEKWCFYLLKNSKSASISAVVASVVQAESEKLFNVAQVLFRTKDFFAYDAARMQLDMSAKSNYSISHDPVGIYRNERLSTCDDKHRNSTLEHLTLTYQVFRSESISEEIAKQRQETIWSILDSYYEQLPEKSQETDGDKTWRLCLARMDRRKMNISTEKQDDGVFITFEPEIETELRSYSENALRANAEMMKHTPLKLWSHQRFKRDEDDYKKYQQYEENPKSALSEVREIIEDLKSDDSDERTFTLFYRAVPAYVCAVLIRDFFDVLDSDEREFCKNVVVECASSPLRDGYEYQVGDGLDAAVNVLPLLLTHFTKDAAEIKRLIIFGLFNPYPASVSSRSSDFAVSAILEHLWKASVADANSLFLGYLVLKPKFDVVSETVREERIRNQEYNFSFAPTWQRFAHDARKEVREVVDNQLSYGDLPDLRSIEPSTLVTAFLLLPVETKDENHKTYVREITPVIVEAIKSNERREVIDYSIEQQFVQKFAHFVLSSDKQEIASFLEPVLSGFEGFQRGENLLSAFVSTEDRLNHYEEFWTVWNLFYPKLVELCQKDRSGHWVDSIVHTYLLAWPYWKESAKDWHSLKDREKSFFRKVAKEIGDHPAVLYSLAKLFNDIGSSFADDGVLWIADIVNQNADLSRKKLEVNTVFYLERLLRGYVFRNRSQIRTTPPIRSRLLSLLEFLVDKGSVTAYMLREEIL